MRHRNTTMNVLRFNKPRIFVALLVGVVCSVVAFVVYTRREQDSLLLSEEFDLMYDGRPSRSRLNVAHKKLYLYRRPEQLVAATEAPSYVDDTDELQYDPVKRDRERFMREYVGGDDDYDYKADPPAEQQDNYRFDNNNDIIADEHDYYADDDDDYDDDDDDNENAVFRDGDFDAANNKTSNITTENHSKAAPTTLLYQRSVASDQRSSQALVAGQERLVKTATKGRKLHEIEYWPAPPVVQSHNDHVLETERDSAGSEVVRVKSPSNRTLTSPTLTSQTLTSPILASQVPARQSFDPKYFQKVETQPLREEEQPYDASQTNTSAVRHLAVTEDKIFWSEAIEKQKPEGSLQS